jgi:hypothetical protein
MINEMIQNANLANEPVVLNPVWTENKDFSIITKKANGNLFVSYDNLNYFNENMFQENIHYRDLDKLRFEINSFLRNCNSDTPISLSDITTLAYLETSITDYIEDQYNNPFSTIFDE